MKKLSLFSVETVEELITENSTESTTPSPEFTSWETAGETTAGTVEVITTTIPDYSGEIEMCITIGIIQIVIMGLILGNLFATTFLNRFH